MVHRPWRDEDRWEKTGLRAAGRETTSGWLFPLSYDFTAARESWMQVVVVPTGGLEPLDVTRRAEVEAPQVEEEEQEGDDRDEDERNDGGGHGHHADILEKQLLGKGGRG